MFKAWMVWRYLQDGRKYLSLTFILSVLGIALGVAALIIAMAVVSGYESTLRDSVINMQGHLSILKWGGLDEEDSKFYAEKLRKEAPEIQALTSFVIVEGLIVHNKKLAGVALEGVDPDTVNLVNPLGKFLVQGEVNFNTQDGITNALIGKGIATKFSLKLNDELKLVVPVSRTSYANSFQPKVKRFRVVGILDLGRADYDERFIVADIKSTQEFGELDGRISGWRVRLNNYKATLPVIEKLRTAFPDTFRYISWSDSNKNLFQAVKYEKVVIFIIVSLMIVAAAFNVASTLYLNVVRRYAQISILKTMGVTNKFIRQLFTYQGLMTAALGTSLGLVFGWLGCQVFVWAEKKWGLFPGDVYKLDFVKLEIRALDVVVIFFCTMLICYIATLAPARRGAKLLPVEGLRYE